MRLAVVQTNPLFGQKQRNLAEALTLLRSVEADLYVLPELFASGYNFATREEAASLAEETAKGETARVLKKFVQERKTFVVYGFAETKGKSLYNSAAIVGYDGTEGLYRKIHLFDGEKLFFEPGDLPFQVFGSPWGKIGIMVCFDWYFPEAARTLAVRGAQLIAHPSNLVLPDCPEGIRTRCLENRVFAATANRIGTEDRGERPLTYIGLSQITSTKGEVLYRASTDTASVGVVDVDLDEAEKKSINARNDLLKDRRPDMYA